MDRTYEQLALESKNAWDAKDFHLAGALFAEARTLVETAEPGMYVAQLPDGSLEKVNETELALLGHPDDHGAALRIIERRRAERK